jgi:hypothetical protein
MALTTLKAFFALRGELADILILEFTSGRALDDDLVDVLLRSAVERQ